MPPEQALEMLRPAEIPGLTKCVLTTAKFDTKKAAKTFNIEANYAREAVELQTLAAWSELGAELSAERLADGLELFALRSIIERDGPFEYVILQRQASALAERWPALKDEIGERLYLDLGNEGLLLNLAGPYGSALIDTLWELHLTGAVYGLENYSLAAALAVAADAIGLTGHASPPTAPLAQG
jgi:hypothetical protein